jgi:hypothetical protein
VLDRPMLMFLRGRRLGLILAAAGVLGGRRATTRRHPVGTEASAPLARLVQICSSVRPIAAGSATTAASSPVEGCRWRLMVHSI